MPTPLGPRAGRPQCTLTLSSPRGAVKVDPDQIIRGKQNGTAVTDSNLYLFSFDFFCKNFYRENSCLSIFFVTVEQGIFYDG